MKGGRTAARPRRRGTPKQAATATTTRQRLDALLGRLVAPWLAERGFQRRGHTFRRERDDAIQVVAIHGSRWNAGQVGRFSCVGALWFPAVAELLKQPQTTRPTWWASHLRWSEHGEHELGRTTDLDALATTIRAELARLLRWLDARTRLERAWRAMPKPPHYPPPLAVQDALRALAGRKPLARPSGGRPGRKSGFAVLSLRRG